MASYDLLRKHASTMVPVPKDKRSNKSDSSNYRAIAISRILGKFLDSIIIQDQYVSLKTDDLPFGFKENTSTIICTQLLIEAVEYYNSNNTDCFMLLLDASKVFDRIEYFRLFELYDTEICVQLFYDSLLLCIYHRRCK